MEIFAQVTELKLGHVSWYMAPCPLELWLCSFNYGMEAKVREGELVLTFSVT